MLSNSLVGLLLLAQPFGEPPSERGISLGLFASTDTYDYRELLAEIKPQTQASHLSIVWVWWQDNISATKIHPKPGWSATDHQILSTLKAAKDAGFTVTAFPIVRLVNAAQKEWRGKIKPTNEEEWWNSYFDYIAHAAALASAAGISRLTIGSELLSREPMRKEWLSLIDRIRLRHPNLSLLYSANWDHYRPVSFWDAIDHIGITGYWEVGKNVSDHNEDALVAAWSPVLKELRQWSKEIQRPLIITEIGYPSIDGGMKWPWDQTRKAPINLKEQVHGYRAVARAFSDQDFIQGLYWWNWFGFGGETDGNYTPRGKPAREVIHQWYDRNEAPSSN